MPLPNTGDENWGNPLNDYINNTVLAQANSAAAGIASHQSGADPHGDRAYAAGLIAPLTSGVNGPNGLLQLDGSGRVPSSVLPTGGGRTSTFDVVKDYSAPTNGTSASTQIQSALTAAGAVGGGEVWVGDGTFGIDTALYVPSNVWLHLSPGATMNRILNSGSGLAPAYMVANFNGSSSSSGSGNILIEGGQWVFDGQTAAGSPMAFIDGSQVIVQNTTIRTRVGSPAIVVAGMTGFGARDILFATGTPGNRASSASNPPAIRIENASSGVLSGLNSGIYTNSPCAFVTIESCAITGATASDGTGLYTAFGGLVGTTAPASAVYNTNILVAGNAAVALPGNGMAVANWSTATVTNNQLNLNNGTTTSVSWSPSTPPASANQVIANNTAADTGGSGGGSTTPGVTYSYKSSATTRANTTSLTLDPDLQLPVVANGVYEANLLIAYDSSSTSAGISWDIKLPSGATFIYAAHEPASDATDYLFYLTAGNSDFNGTNGSSQILRYVGMLKVGANSGTFGLLWAQHNSNSLSTGVYPGSFLRLMRVA